MITEPNRIRVWYSLDFWTPVVRDVFEGVLPRLTHLYSQILYLALYDKVWHSRTGQFVATPTEMGRLICADERTINRCLCELIRHRFVDVVNLGRARSRTSKPIWKVPATKFDFRTEGPWTPVPRFFIYDFPRVYPKSILLVILLWHQHIGWHNSCWPGVTRLTKLTGWSSRSVYLALNTMGRKRRWDIFGLNLPLPLDIWTNIDKHGKEHRHFRVRAVFYEPKRGRGRSAVMLTKEFATLFNVRTGNEFIDLEFQDEA